MMHPMCTITEEKFQKSFEDLLSSLIRFLEKCGKEGQQKWGNGDHKNGVELLLEVNNMCSTSRGVRGAKPVFVIREVMYINKIFSSVKVQIDLHSFLTIRLGNTSSRIIRVLTLVQLFSSVLKVPFTLCSSSWDRPPISVTRTSKYRVCGPSF